MTDKHGLAGATGVPAGNPDSGSQGCIAKAGSLEASKEHGGPTVSVGGNTVSILHHLSAHTHRAGGIYHSHRSSAPPSFPVEPGR